jgi:uncharacterized BrkB/YihY/UPF0761 family membrane protein
MNAPEGVGLAAETAFFDVLSIFPALLTRWACSPSSTSSSAPMSPPAPRTKSAGPEQRAHRGAAPAVASVENLFESRRGQLLTVAALGALMTLRSFAE